MPKTGLNIEQLTAEFIAEFGIAESDTKTREAWGKMSKVIVNHFKNNGIVTVSNVTAGADSASGDIS